MSKGLETLEKLRKDDFKNDNLHLNRHCCYVVIEKELNALDIIIEKKVNIQYFISSLEVGWSYELFEQYCQDNAEWEEFPPYVHSMTKEQFEIVKEVLS